MAASRVSSCIVLVVVTSCFQPALPARAVRVGDETLITKNNIESLSNTPRPSTNTSASWEHRRRHLTQGFRGGGALVDVDSGTADGDLERAGNKIPRIIHFLWKTATLPRFAEAGPYTSFFFQLNSKPKFVPLGNQLKLSHFIAHRCSSS